MGEHRVEGPFFVGEQPPAQAVDLLAAAGVRLGPGCVDRGSGAGGLDPVGPLDLPRGDGRPLDQELLDHVAGRQDLGPAIEPMAEGVGVLAGQDGRRGAHAVLDGIELRTQLSFG